jgi:hypothetical protein
MSRTSLDDEHSVIICTKAIHLVLTAAGANAHEHTHTLIYTFFS